ncbi:MAG: multidrug ABC transporter substrate-binding protein, partial [Bryobacteraceae bacterium]|nr:multidrug ABC transporter substrate-binding protein [Bryobacteraceae bacterium]
MTRAEFTENLRVALDTLRAHKVRSSLTLLGIVIGVTSVIGVAAIINGLNR